MRVRTVGARTTLTERVWPAHLLLAVLGLGAMALAWDAWHKGLADLTMVTLIGGFGVLMLAPNLGLHQMSLVFDTEQRVVVLRRHGLFSEARRLTFDAIAEVVVITRDTDEGVDHQIAVRPIVGEDIRFGAYSDLSKAQALAARPRGLLG